MSQEQPQLQGVAGLKKHDIKVMEDILITAVIKQDGIAIGAFGLDLKSTKTIFFKAKDADAINKLMTDYAAQQLKKEQKAERPSILKKLQKFKEFVAKLPRKEHEKRKEHER